MAANQRHLFHHGARIITTHKPNWCEKIIEIIFFFSPENRNSTWSFLDFTLLYFKAIFFSSSRACIPAASHQILKQTRSLRQDVISPRVTENTCPATSSLCFVNAVVTVVSVSLLPLVKDKILPLSPLRLKKNMLPVIKVEEWICGMEEGDWLNQK